MITDRYVFSLSCPRKFCFDRLFAGAPEVEQMSELRVTLGRYRAVGWFDLEHVTSNVGVTGHTSPISAAVALGHVRDQHVTLRGPRFACCPVWLHTLGNSAVEPLQRQSCYPLVAWDAP